MCACQKSYTSIIITSITWTGPRCVQEQGTILAPQNRIKGHCVMCIVFMVVVVMGKLRNSKKLYLPHKGYHLLPLNHQLNGVRKLHDGYNTEEYDNVQFIYICKGRRDDPNIALLVFLSKGTITCHVFWNCSLKYMPEAKRRKGNGINIKIEWQKWAKIGQSRMYLQATRDQTEICYFANNKHVHCYISFIVALCVCVL